MIEAASEKQNEIEMVSLIHKMSDDELHSSAVKTAEHERKLEYGSRSSS